MKPLVTQKTALISVADQHINSTVALSPRVFNLDDGGTFHSSRFQRWLWECWTDFCHQADELTQGYRRIAVFDGDLIELDTMRRSAQLITVNKATILSMVAETIAPLVDFTDANLFIRGTEAHTGKSQWGEENVARDTLNTIRDKKNKTYSWLHYRRTCNMTKLDIAHHAPVGQKPWTRNLSAVALANLIRYEYQCNMNIPAPDLVLRSHNHIRLDSGENSKTHVFYLPCWSGMTEYSYRIGLENSLPDIGGYIFFIEPDGWSYKQILYPFQESKRIWAARL